MSGANFARDTIKSIVQRVEKLEDEKAALAADIKEIFAEGRAHGLDVGILRQVIRLRKMDAADRSARAELVDLYMSATEGLSE